MNFITQALWGLFLAVLPFALYGFGLSLARVLAEKHRHGSPELAFGAGAVIFVVAYRLTRRLLHRPWHYLSTLEHELTHAFIGLLFCKIPVSLRATAYDGGAVVFRNGSNVWIRLAPYYFPTLSLLLLLVHYLLWQSVSVVFYILLGATVAFHLLTTWQETSFHQPDLQKSGRLATCLILPLMNLLFYGSIMSFVAKGAEGLGGFWFHGMQNSGLAWGRVWRFLTGG